MQRPPSAIVDLLACASLVTSLAGASFSNAGLRENDPGVVQVRLGGLVLLAPRAGCASPKPSEMPRSVHTVPALFRRARCDCASSSSASSASISSEDSEDEAAPWRGAEGARSPVLCHKPSDDTPSKPTFRRGDSSSEGEASEGEASEGEASEGEAFEDEASCRGAEDARWAVLCPRRWPLRRFGASSSASSEDAPSCQRIADACLPVLCPLRPPRRSCVFARWRGSASSSVPSELDGEASRRGSDGACWPPVRWPA